ncbi:MAG: 2-oxoglutarate dehydrogenase complex dihydrolipoyllysine-residue succinyltransferase [Proteobacteria bacterium]|nr:2-oxoglutarate dehydrogenase complex dihydrolipoyllysine-residue succinyltransferase [Pseudomonadota bacterium]
MANKLVEIKVPPLGDSVTEATIAKWHKKSGDTVRTDELLVEIETDKVTMEVNAPATGVLAEVVVADGATVGVGALLGRIEEKAIAAAAPAPVALAPKPATHAPIATPTKSVSAAGIASPAANKIAAEQGINIAGMVGSGKDGRITKTDALMMTGSPAAAISASQPHEERVKMSKLRQTIARRLKDSQNTAAILTTFNEIDMSEVSRIRQLYQDKFVEKHGVKLGFMSFFVKAVVAALKEIPAVNAEIDGEYIVYKNHYDIGVAVGTEQGLVVPVLRGADQLSFADIEKGIAELGKKAREGKLSMADMSGGTFSITNGGIYGSLLSTPIINPPQSGILGMHNIVQRPVALNGQVVIRPMMYIALSYDHRMIDGKEAVTFIIRIKEMVENPEKLLFDI